MCCTVLSSSCAISQLPLPTFHRLGVSRCGPGRLRTAQHDGRRRKIAELWSCQTLNIVSVYTRNGSCSPEVADRRGIPGCATVSSADKRSQLRSAYFARSATSISTARTTFAAICAAETAIILTSCDFDRLRSLFSHRFPSYREAGTNQRVRQTLPVPRAFPKCVCASALCVCGLCVSASVDVARRISCTSEPKCSAASRKVI